MEEETNESNNTLNRWHIANVGVIITHPFLSQLFKYLNYLNDMDQFKNEDLQFRAVYLLHFIATGQDRNNHEVDLAMPKALCGLRIQDPIPANLVLMENEKDMAVELLSVLINRWDKLGNTSPEGLRTTFLIRNGLLEYKDNAYQLTVESSGTDILLDYIPWHINIIKLPWLEHLIYTSWR